jgi:putative spermidine/putrescine transport system ATP-binding protein
LWNGIVRGANTVETDVGLLHSAATLPAPGTRVTVLVRPERVRLGRGPAGVNTLEGSLVRDRFLGATRRYDLAVQGGQVVGETAEAGAVEAVHVPPERVQILPADPSS